MNEKEIKQIASDMRRDIVEMAHNCGTMGAHLGGSLSAVDILAVLYTQVMKHDGDTRDRFIMSKAHSVMAQYAALRQIRRLTSEDIKDAMKVGSELFKHPCMNIDKGIEFSGGSLGQGLSLGVGTALALKMLKKNQGNVYVMVGDGECDEGAIWEAAACASHYRLSNLTVIIDRNNLQNDGATESILNFNNMGERWSAFGFYSIEIDGHNYYDIYNALIKTEKKPRAIIANTIKGKGVSFAENNVAWHAAYLNDELYEIALEDIKNA